MLDIGFKSRRINGSLDGHSGSHAAPGHTRHQAEILAVVAAFASATALSARGTTIAGQHPDMASTFIDYHQASGIQAGDQVPKGLSLWLIALLGCQRLFL